MNGGLDVKKLIKDLEVFAAQIRLDNEEIENWVLTFEWFTSADHYCVIWKIMKYDPKDPDGKTEMLYFQKVTQVLLFIQHWH